MKIIVVDDNKTFRDAIKDYLENYLGHNVIWEGSSGEEFLDEAPAHMADIILMDIEMHRVNGIDATHAINIRVPWAKIIAVTMNIEKIFLLQLIENGFKGCVSKSEIAEKLEIALNRVNSGQLFFPNYIKISDKLI